MNADYSRLRSPRNARPLKLVGDELLDDEGNRYPVIGGIPRFVSGENYAESFGRQWNRYRRNILDSDTGVHYFRDRLQRCLRSDLSVLKGKRVLEPGSGAGPFTQILLSAGAIVDSFDYSNAVETNADNNGDSPNLTLVQADIMHMPFQPLSYDVVICLGVLQHTPSPEESIRRLYDMVRPGGALVIDHYLFQWRNYLPAPIGAASLTYRQFMKLVPAERRIAVVNAIVDFFFPVHWKFRDSPAMQRLLRRVSPVAFYYPRFGRDREMYYDWALVDTHDTTTDFFHHFRTLDSIRRTLASLGATDIVVSRGGNGVEAYCRRPA